MGNMSYVRFENTLRDLEDCYEHINDRVSERERRERKRLVELCQVIAEEADNGDYDLEQERPRECEHCAYETQERADMERHYEVEHEDEYYEEAD